MNILMRLLDHAVHDISYISSLSLSCCREYAICYNRPLSNLALSFISILLLAPPFSNDDFNTNNLVL